MQQVSEVESCKERKKKAETVKAKMFLYMILCIRRVGKELNNAQKCWGHPIT